MKKYLIILSIFFAFYKIHATNLDKNLMYESYLDNDMNRWGIELKRYSEQKEITLDDKLEICNYLYGYIATILENEEPNIIEWWMELWNKYLNDLEEAGYNNANIHVYRSAWHAYQYNLHPSRLSHASMSLKEADIAIDMEKDNALALSLKGNIKFYTPRIVGGNKKEAAKFFTKAIEQFEKEPNDLYKWNKMAAKLCLAQTYEKLGDKEHAIKYCQEILKEEPRFKYIKDIYLPSLLK